MLDACYTSKEIGEAQPAVAVLGIGAIEQHGRHLPVGTDWLTVRELARRVADGLEAYLVPALPFSMSQCHGATAGTVWLRPETLAKVIRDIALSLREQGMCRIVLVNGHGGNIILEVVLRELNLSYPDLMVIMPRLGPILEEAGIFEPVGPEVHAGQSESSYQLFLNTDHVKGERVDDYVPPVGQEFLDYTVMATVSPHGVWGKPSLGSAEKGQQAMEAAAEAIVAQACALFEQLAKQKRSIS